MATGSRFGSRRDRFGGRGDQVVYICIPIGVSLPPPFRNGNPLPEIANQGHLLLTLFRVSLPPFGRKSLLQPHLNVSLFSAQVEAVKIWVTVSRN